jgi:hypothetical protein
MSAAVDLGPALEIAPLTPSTWEDFEALFGHRGAYGGCWCMWWRISRGEFERQHGEGNRRAMKALGEPCHPPAGHRRAVAAMTRLGRGEESA